MSENFFLPKGAFADVKALVGLTERQLRSLDELFATAESLSPHTPEFLDKLSSRVQLEPSSARSVVLICQFLLAVVDNGTSPKAVVDDLREFLEQCAQPEDRNLLAAFDVKRPVLEALLTPKPARLRAAKVRYLTHGLQPTVDSFRTVCELRPVFECQDGRETIVGYASAITMEVKMSDSSGEDQTVFLYFTPKALHSLAEVVKRTEEKVEALRAKFGRDLLDP